MKILKNIIPYLFLLFGLGIFFYPVLLNPSNMPGDIGDARFISYVLEHGYLWLTQSGIHKSFWDMPFYYPYTNTLAFSDILLGGMLFYAPLRLIVASPQTAVQIWFLIACLLNFTSMYLLMRKTFKFEKVPSSAAAFLFAFGLPRHVQIVHLQLMLQFFMIFSIFAFTKINQQNSALKNHLLFLTGSLLFVMELYTSFYFGWFMVFGSLAALLICIMFKNLRGKIIDFTKKFFKEILTYGILSLILLIPLVHHYLAVGHQFNWTYEYLFKFCSFLTSQSMIDHYILKIPFRFNPETHTGMGFFTTVIVMCGLWKTHSKKPIFLFITLMVIFFWNLDLNLFLYKHFPGASAIRAGARCIFLLLPIFAYGLANFLKLTKNRILLSIFIVLFLAEQIPYRSGYNWTKQEHLQRLSEYTFPSECSVVYYDIKKEPQWLYNIDIIWKASNENIYTANGYSGYQPPYIEGSVPPNCTFAINE